MPGQLKKGRGVAGKGKRGGLPFHIGLAGALHNLCFGANITKIIF